jgi:hypothetical protein
MVVSTCDQVPAGACGSLLLPQIMRKYCIITTIQLWGKAKVQGEPKLQNVDVQFLLNVYHF